MWTPLEPTYVTTKSQILCRCNCGTERKVWVADLLSGVAKMCRPCSARLRQAATPAETRRQNAKRASVAAAEKVRAAYLANKEAIDAFRRVRAVMYGAKARCHPTRGHENYAGRGIEFRFDSAGAAANWVLANLGPCPEGCSIDRVDNDGHYEPGNLRWATRTEQANNKRRYKGPAYGQRLAHLMQLRPDYTYEGLRRFVRLGWSDEQIVNHRKGTHVRTGI